MKWLYRNSLKVSLLVLAYVALWFFLLPSSSSSDNGISQSDFKHNNSCTSLNETHEKETISKISETLSNIYDANRINILLLTDAIQRFGANSPEVKNLTERKLMQDEINGKAVAHIIETYGWPEPDQIGIQNSYTLFTSIQNSDLQTQGKLLGVMEKAVKEGKLAPENYASLVDRKALVEHRQQIFGTIIQKDLATGQYSFAPIIRVDTVNDRRREIGLPPIEEFAKANNVLCGFCPDGI
jgi:hypothetical protein